MAAATAAAAATAPTDGRGGGVNGSQAVDAPRRNPFLAPLSDMTLRELYWRLWDTPLDLGRQICLRFDNVFNFRSRHPSTFFTNQDLVFKEIID